MTVLIITPPNEIAKTHTAQKIDTFRTDILLLNATFFVIDPSMVHSLWFDQAVRQT